MKKRKQELFDKEGVPTDPLGPRHGMVTHDTTATEVLVVVDGQLKAFGLEIILIEGSNVDYPVWRIEALSETGGTLDQGEGSVTRQAPTDPQVLYAG